jgi:hypothetical protein
MIISLAFDDSNQSYFLEYEKAMARWSSALLYGGFFLDGPNTVLDFSSSNFTIRAALILIHIVRRLQTILVVSGLALVLSSSVSAYGVAKRALNSQTVRPSYIL